ncbi:MAG: ATP-binding protein [Candidatus Gastranaerophilales bacterium]|nr:ATP-binding protein [Candidatus Gastranaerophilales bacterium]
MERIENIDRSQKTIERFVIIMYTMYNSNFVIGSLWKGWASWIPAVLAVVMTVSWFLYWISYKDFRVRALAMAAMMQVSVILYAVNSEDLSSVLTTLLAFAVILGLYMIPEVSYFIWAGSAFILLYYALTKDSLAFWGTQGIPHTIGRISNIFVVEYAIYMWARKRSESNRQLMEVIEVMREAEQSKDDFLANVSHELRTPVNTICGMSEIVLQSEDPRRMKEAVYDIQTAGRNLMSVISDILDFSELQADKLEIEEEAYNITSTVNDVINMSVAEKKDKPLELIVDCDADLPQVLLGDEKKIRRVIMNIMKNAIKYSNEGCVTMTVTVRREKYGVNLIITVKDTGIGMDEEALEKLFTSFNQVDSKRNRQEGGIGLGMAISKAIVQKMGGIITVKSKFGKGTDIKLVIPQQVVDERPITYVKDREKLYVGAYINMEQFEMTAIRDDYTNCIRHMMSQLDVRSHMCRNLAELKRRQEKEGFTHIFISRVEYQEDPEYFDKLSEQVCLVAVIGHNEEKYIGNENIRRVYKPFYVVSIVNVLNNNLSEQGRTYPVRPGRFLAPDVHVLVVDDNIMNIKVIQGLLEKYYIRVTAALSGREALEKIESMDYDFVFMDHMMPEMDGIETLHHIRRKVGTYYSNVPVIALTANAVAGMREMFLSEGFADFVEKPVEISVIERVLKRNLPKEKIILLEEGENLPPGENAKKDDQQAESLVVGDLNVQKGFIYCGGREQYLAILKLYDQSGSETLEKMDGLYLDRDWKNYVILVHAVKSSMQSIGAERLSEMAKNLEMSGKENRIDYILDHHQEMMEEYKRVLQILHDFLHQDVSDEEQETEQSLPELSEEQFAQLAASMEDAMYELDGQGMLAVLEELQRYQYCGVSLKTQLAFLRHKIEMSDYMSAVENVQKVKTRLENREGGEA